MRRMLKCKMPGYSLMCPSGDQFCAEYRAVYDAMTNPPDADIAAQQDLMVRALVASGVWTKLDIFYLFAQQSNADGEALINWINPGTFDATLVNAPAFASLEGFTGDGASAYINSNFTASTDAIRTSQNDSCHFIYIRSNIAEDTVDCGVYTPAADSQIISRWSTNKAYVRINTNDSNNGNNSDSRGLFIANRNENTKQYLYRNNIALIDGLKPSTGLPTDSFYILAVNDGGPVNFSTKQVSLFGIGSNLDNTHRQDEQDAYEAYMDSNGKGVIP